MDWDKLHVKINCLFELLYKTHQAIWASLMEQNITALCYRADEINDVFKDVVTFTISENIKKPGAARVHLQTAW